MLVFNELKEDVLKRAKAANACTDEYKRAYKAETKEELLQVIVDNVIWCYQNKMLDTPYMLEHFIDLFDQFGIYATGHHCIENKNTILIGDSSATIETWDSSSATIKTCGSSSATIKTWDSSSATIETCGSSSATIKTWGSSSATIKTWDSSSATIETWGSSSATYQLSGDYSTIKDMNQHKLLVKKSKFEIIEIE